MIKPLTLFLAAMLLALSPAKAQEKTMQKPLHKPERAAMQEQKQAQMPAEKEHAILTLEEMSYKPGPKSLPAGIEHAVLYGDPASEGQFVMRLKMPAGYHIPPHTHPVLESVTVISGAFRLGLGETAMYNGAELLETGGYFGLPAGTPHYAYADEAAVVQINGLGPWEINYINPEDDPRNKVRQTSQ